MVPAKKIMIQDTQSKVLKILNMSAPLVKLRISSAVIMLELFRYQDTVNSENFAIFRIAMVPPALRNGLIRVSAQINHMGIFGYNAVSSSSLYGLIYVP